MKRRPATRMRRGSGWFEVLVLVSFAWLGGCAAKSNAPAETPPLEKYEIVVREFDTTGAEVWRMEDADIRPLGLGQAEVIASNIQWWAPEGWDTNRARVEPDPKPAPGRLLIEGRLTYIDGGSRSMRYFVGFGAGNVEIWAKGRVVGPDGHVLATFESAQGCSRAWFGGAYKDLLKDCLDAVAYDVVDLVAEGRFEFAPGTGPAWNPGEFAPVHGPMRIEPTGERKSSPEVSETVEERLEKLKKLKEKGVISQEEYDAQRKRMLDSL